MERHRRVIIGIDPGWEGGIAFIEEFSMDVSVVAMPVIVIADKARKSKAPTPVESAEPLKKRRKPKVKKLLDAEGLRDLLTRNPVCHCFVEKSQPMPKQGVAGVGSYMKSYGIIIGMLIALRVPYTEVSPVTWKKAMMNGMGKEKEMSFLRARQLFPALQFPLKKDDGKAEAVLIAEYGRRIIAKL